LASSRRLTSIAWCGTQICCCLPKHSRATASKEFSAESFLRRLVALRSADGSRFASSCWPSSSRLFRASFRETRKDPNGEGLLLASLPLAHPPISPAIKIDPEIEAISIMELADSQPFTRGVFTLNRGQKIGGHRGNSCSVVTFYHDFCHDQGLDAMGSYHVDLDAYPL
jgi:hypothetical protein